RADEDFLTDKITLDEYLSILSRPDDCEKIDKCLKQYAINDFKAITEYRTEFTEDLIESTFYIRPDFILHSKFIDRKVTSKYIDVSFMLRLEIVFQFGTRGI